MSITLEHIGLNKNVIDAYVDVSGVGKKILGIWGDDSGVSKKLYTSGGLGPQVLQGVKPTGHTIDSDNNITAWSAIPNWYDASDATYGYASIFEYSSAGRLRLTGFDLSAIPDNAIIDGAEFIVRARSGTSGRIVELNATLHPVPSGGVYSLQTSSTTPQNFTLGGPTAKWGENLTPVFLKDPGFLVYLTFGNESAGTTRLYIYDLYLNIHYH